MRLGGPIQHKINSAEQNELIASTRNVENAENDRIPVGERNPVTLHPLYYLLHNYVLAVCVIPQLSFVVN